MEMLPVLVLLVTEFKNCHWMKTSMTHFTTLILIYKGNHRFLGPVPAKRPLNKQRWIRIRTLKNLVQSPIEITEHTCSPWTLEIKVRLYRLNSKYTVILTRFYHWYMFGAFEAYLEEESQISNLYFNTVKIQQVFCYIWSINYITIFNNNKYISKESLKNTTQNYTKLYLFSMNAVYLT